MTIAKTISILFILLCTLGASAQEGCTSPTASNFDSEATIDDGSCTWCGINEYFVELSMFDSGGDGWNGANYIIYDLFSGVVYASGNLESAAIGDGVSFGNEFLCISQPDYCAGIEVFGGDSPEEVSWHLTDASGNDVLGSYPINTVTFFSGNWSLCDSEGCVDTEACNYHPGAIFPDNTLCVYAVCGDPLAFNYDPSGSCFDVSLCLETGDINGDMIIDTGDLLVLISEFGCESNCESDMDGDSLVNTTDLLIFLSTIGG